MTIFTATAHTNIALIKYWGKSADLGNLPATGSLSLTLDAFFTTTTVQLTYAPHDLFFLNNAPADSKTLNRVVAHADLVRSLTGRRERLRIESHNNVPTSSGLASSASGFAALTLALAQAFGLDADTKELSKIARQGSGSAARSLFRNFALMHGGPHIDHDQAYAEPLMASSTLDVRMVVVECSQSQKAIGSREAMRLTSQTSIFYQAFLENHPGLLERAARAVSSGDLEELGTYMEQSTMQMHATMLGCDAPFWYFNRTTIAAIDEVRRLRRDGYSCYFTMDAGPHVKILCATHEADFVAQQFNTLDGVSKVSICGPGPAAYCHD